MNALERMTQSWMNLSGLNVGRSLAFSNAARSLLRVAVAPTYRVASLTVPIVCVMPDCSLESRILVSQMAARPIITSSAIDCSERSRRHRMALVRARLSHSARPRW